MLFVKEQSGFSTLGLRRRCTLRNKVDLAPWLACDYAVLNNVDLLPLGCCYLSNKVDLVLLNYEDAVCKGTKWTYCLWLAKMLEHRKHLRFLVCVVCI